ncbi:hypothetical protein ENBRE01_0840 [Enteropsectra breve]|nr:hypothetical protein ENBRE01_0840 [Enteropsectra breve]
MPMVVPAEDKTTSKPQHCEPADILQMGLLENLSNYKIFKLRYPKHQRMPTRELENWYVQIGVDKHEPRLYLIGNCGDKLIKTSPVLTVQTRNRVCTTNATYILKAQAVPCADADSILNDRFREGFPINWRIYLKNDASSADTPACNAEELSVNKENDYTNNKKTALTTAATEHTVADAFYASPALELASNKPVTENVSEFLSHSSLGKSTAESDAMASLEQILSNDCALVENPSLLDENESPKSDTSDALPIYEQADDNAVKTEYTVLESEHARPDASLASVFSDICDFKRGSKRSLTSNEDSKNFLLSESVVRGNQSADEITTKKNKHRTGTSSNSVEDRLKLSPFFKNKLLNIKQLFSSKNVLADDKNAMEANSSSILESNTSCQLSEEKKQAVDSAQDAINIKQSQYSKISINQFIDSMNSFIDKHEDNLSVSDHGHPELEINQELEMITKPEDMELNNKSLELISSIINDTLIQQKQEVTGNATDEAYSKALDTEVSSPVLQDMHETGVGVACSMNLENGAEEHASEEKIPDVVNSVSEIKVSNSQVCYDIKEEAPLIIVQTPKRKVGRPRKNSILSSTSFANDSINSTKNTSKISIKIQNTSEKHSALGIQDPMINNTEKTEIDMLESTNPVASASETVIGNLNTEEEQKTCAPSVVIQLPEINSGDNMNVDLVQSLVQEDSERSVSSLATIANEELENIANKSVSFKETILNRDPSAVAALREHDADHSDPESGETKQIKTKRQSLSIPKKRKKANVCRFKK